MMRKDGGGGEGECFGLNVWRLSIVQNGTKKLHRHARQDVVSTRVRFGDRSVAAMRTSRFLDLSDAHRPAEFFRTEFTGIERFVEFRACFLFFCR